MKKYIGIIVLIVAVGFGVLAFTLVNRWMTSQADAVEPVKIVSNPTTKIVIASQEIDVGTTLTKKVINLVDWPKSYVPEGAFADINEVKERVAAIKMVAGEPILENKLASPGSGAGLVATIHPNMRAMSIKVDEVIGVAGFIQPNMYVDVISVQVRRDNHDKAETILEKIRVLAIAQETVTEEGKPKVVRTVTLEVTPRQSEQLALQTSKAHVHLVLRNPEKPRQIEIAEKPKEKKVPPQKYVPVLKSRIKSPKLGPFDVEVIRGVDRENLRFKNFKSEEKA